MRPFVIEHRHYPWVMKPGSEIIQETRTVRTREQQETRPRSRAVRLSGFVPPLLAIALCLALVPRALAALLRLKVSDNNRFLVYVTVTSPLQNETESE